MSVVKIMLTKPFRVSENWDELFALLIDFQNQFFHWEVTFDWANTRTVLSREGSRFLPSAPKKIESGGFTLKTNQMFSVHTTLVEFKNATIAGHFGFVVKETSDMEITTLSWCHRSWKAPSSRSFQRKASILIFRFRFDAECFREAPYSWWIRMNGRPNRRNKAAF